MDAPKSYITKTRQMPSNLTTLRNLPKGKGFPMRLLPPREDPLARAATEQYFGLEKVAKVMAKYHRSTISYEAMLSDLKRYDCKRAPRLEDDLYCAVLQTVIEDILPKERIIPYKIEVVSTLAEFPNTKSPGLPYKLEGFKTKREVIEAGKLSDISTTWREIGFGKKPRLPDVCLFARSQLAKTGKEKIRATWGYPLSVYMEEGRYFYPFQDHIKSHEHNFPIAYGLEILNGGMAMIDTIVKRNENAKYVMTDWSQFDKTVPAWLIRDVFSIIGMAFDFSKERDANGNIYHVRPAIAIKRWRYMINYFIDTPIRTCKGERFLALGGVPSGSCWTNIVDSVINMILSRYLVFDTTGHFPADEIFLGDDAFLCVNGTVNLDDMADLALRKFGMIMNVDKSYVTTQPANVHFLGYYNKSGNPFFSMDPLIASFIQPEYERSTLLERCSAAIGQMYCCCDPGYAVLWYKIASSIAASDNKTFEEVFIYTRDSYHRNKDLQQMGLTQEKMTVPSICHDYIMDVLPPLNCRIFIRPRKYNYNELWERTILTFKDSPLDPE
uniref:RNA-dependent RNA polymerase n=1 Tax=Vannostrand partiti-like virus TaxID=2716666 RepID=A0A6G7PSH5_9VIRU|nr:RNA-dependent RNA polymerase [Vannostrand partiti-like virus]